MEIKIEKGIAAPPARTGNMTETIRILMRSEVGDSAYIPYNVGKDVRVRANQVGGRGWYATRSDDNGTRIWKIAEPNWGIGNVL
jgi:hypothetical protein